MGQGVAQAAVTAGFAVEMLDVSVEVAKQACAEVTDRLNGRVAGGRLSRPERDEIVSRLRVATSYDGMKDAECVIEAVPEDLSLKREVFGGLGKVVSPRTLLATNTSSLSITKIAEGLNHADRFLGMHFFNPAPVMKLVELVRGPATSEQAVVEARSVCLRLGKTPVRVKDSPGFIGNRVNRPFYLEALRLVETGEAGIRTVDQAVKDVGGFRMGPFELLDLIGLDVNLRVTETLYNDLGMPARFAPSAVQQKLVSAGHLGRKAGRGFYDYSNGPPTPAYETPPVDVSSWQPTPALRGFAEVLKKPADRATWVYARILVAVINEAAVVADSIALPRDVNLAMELGFNYPEGPLATADHVGLDVIQRLLNDFRERSHRDGRYEPNPLLDRHVADGNLGEQTARGFLHHSL